jgi:hypothetical protein
MFSASTPVDSPRMVIISGDSEHNMTAILTGSQVATPAPTPVATPVALNSSDSSEHNMTTNRSKRNRAKDETMDCPPKKPMTQKPKLPKDERMENIGLVVKCCSRLTSRRVQSCFVLGGSLDKISAAAASVEHFLNAYHTEIVFLNGVINKDNTPQRLDLQHMPRIQKLKVNMEELLERIKRESIA